MDSAKKVLPILVFSALPASGKSESRRYLKSLNKEQTEKFHLGETSTQVDDYPYVDAMYKIDDHSKRILGEPIFFDPVKKILDGWEYAVLTYLINDDYFDIKKCNPKIPSKYLKDPVDWLLNRYDVAAVKTGHMTARFFELKKKHGEEKFNEFKKAIEPLCTTILKEKYANIPTSLEGKTIVFEFARGGPKGSSYPITPPYGYEYTLSLFDKEILENAAILYIWVTPEQSYNKNKQRAKEGAEGKSQTVSTQLSLNHGVGDETMFNDYGTDDIEYLLGKSKTGTYLPIMKDDEEIHVRCGRFDNREDLTSDFRKPINEWTPEQIKKMEDAMVKAFDALLAEK
ncbi:MAG: hypothetical protein MJ252_14120 [archaeon]|nr:hypothetical protein [archaeon]